MKPLDYTRVLNELAGRREKFAQATVVRIHGSSLGKPGFKAIISKEGKVVGGTLGGVCPESAIADIALQTMKTGEPRTVKVYLEDVEGALEGTIKSRSEDEIHVETNCGGMMEVYVEPFIPQQRLILIGQGGKDDVEDSLVRLGRLLDLEVIVIDHLPVLSEKPDQLITDRSYDLSNFPFSESDSVIVLTKGARDLPTLEALSKSKTRFVGLLASRQRVKDDLDALRKIGVNGGFIESLHAPVGADIGAISPEEIALSIMTDIIATKYGKSIPRKKLPERETRSGALVAQ